MPGHAEGVDEVVPVRRFLPQPRGGVVGEPEVERRVEGAGRVEGDVVEDAVLRAVHHLAVVAALDGGGERTLELLLELVLVHLHPQTAQLLLVDDARLGGRSSSAIPLVGVGLGVLHHVVEHIFPRRGADEHGEALAVGQEGEQHLRPQTRFHLRWLVQHHPVQVDAPEGVRVVTAEQSDAGAVVQLDRQLRHVHVGPHPRRVLHEVVPRDALGLRVEGGDVGEAGVRFRRVQRGGDQVVDGRDRFPRTPMADEDGPPLLPRMEGDELRARCVVVNDLTHRRRC